MGFGATIVSVDGIGPGSRVRICPTWSVPLLLAAVIASSNAAAEQAPRPEPPPTPLRIDWTRTLRDSVTTPTLQVVVNPKLQPDQAVAKAAYAAFRDLAPDYARYVGWYPYPQMAVAELKPPTTKRTFWKFDLIDPPVLEFLEATKGRNGYLSFSTIPAWMFKTPQPVAYPDDPDQPFFSYNQGNELVDPTGKQLADYYGRLISWYTKGGFTDERGVFHKSRHHYDLPIFEVLNEVEIEHLTTPQQYTARYDAIVAGIKPVSPTTKFIGLALAKPDRHPEFFEYFLDPTHHQPDIPLDWISYHFYAVPPGGQTIDAWPDSLFAQADGFVDTVRYIESIRQRLSPKTRTMVNETGVVLRPDFRALMGERAAEPEIPAAYWNLSGAVYAYLFCELAKLGIDVVGESQLVGYPGQFPSVTMVDWNTGRPNARFQVLKLLRDNVGPGDRIIDTSPDLAAISTDPPVVAMAYIRNGVRKVLLINRRAETARVDLPDAAGGTLQIVDQAGAGGPIRRDRLASPSLSLGGFAVAVVDLPGAS